MVFFVSASLRHLTNFKCTQHQLVWATVAEMLLCAERMLQGLGRVLSLLL